MYAPPIRRRAGFSPTRRADLRLVGEESHSGTHAPINKRWVTGGGGSLIGKACHPLGAALYLKADEGRRLRGAPVRPVSVMAETAQLADTATFRAATPRYLNTVEGADVEDWGTMLITFDDGTVAAISAADTVLGGIRNQMAIYGAKAVVLCNINPNDLVQAYAPDTSVFGNEYIVEKIETKAGWTAPQPDEEWTPATRRRSRLRGVRGPRREPSPTAPSPATSPRSSTAHYLSPPPAAASTSALYRVRLEIRHFSAPPIAARRKCRISRPDPKRSAREADLHEVRRTRGAAAPGARPRLSS